MWQPFVSNNHLAMGFQTRLDSSSLPVPEDDIALAVPTAYPFAVGREADLTGKSSDRVTREAFLSVLPEVVRAVYKDLVVE